MRQRNTVCRLKNDPAQFEDSASLAQRETRWDTLRGVAMIGVLGLHATGPYLARPLPGLLWPVYEPAASITPTAFFQGTGFTDLVFWVCRGFAVPAFCFVAGNLAAKSLESQRPGDFRRKRIRRLGEPLLAGVLVVLPLLYLIWTCGWVRFGWAAWNHIPRGRFGPAVQPHLFGFAHLWYLWYALLYSIALSWVWPLAKRVRVEWTAHPNVAMVLRVTAVLVAGTVIAATLTSATRLFHNGIIPALGFFLYHAVFFAWGAFGPFRRTESSSAIAGWCCLAFGIALGIMHAALVAPGMLTQPNGTAGELAVSARWIAALAGTLQAVLMIYGLATIHIQKTLSTVQRWSRDSLWIYTTHLIWIGIAAVSLYKADLAPEVKSVLAFAMALGGPTLTKRIAARVKLGRWLGASNS